MTHSELRDALRDVICVELPLAEGYLREVHPSDTIEHARSAIQRVLDYVKHDTRYVKLDMTERTPAMWTVELLYETRKALAPVQSTLKPITTNASVTKARTAIGKVLDQCTEVANELGYA